MTNDKPAGGIAGLPAAVVNQPYGWIVVLAVYLLTEGAGIISAPSENLAVVKELFTQLPVAVVFLYAVNILGAQMKALSATIADYNKANWEVMEKLARIEVMVQVALKVHGYSLVESQKPEPKNEKDGSDA